MRLRLPLKNIMVTQYYGQRVVTFYDVHKGVDFKCHEGTSVYSSSHGRVTFAGWNVKGGNMVSVYNEQEQYVVSYCHLSAIEVKAGELVVEGQIIGLSGNTGAWTSGPHLHLQMMTTVNGVAKEFINPEPLFYATYNGNLFSNKDWDKSNAYHRYFRKDRRNLAFEIKKQAELIPYLKRLPTTEQLNAVVYGAWDREWIKNVALREIWAFETKGDYLNGKKTFQ